MELEQKSNGALIGLIVIIVILIVGGVYLWKTSLKENAQEDPYNTAEMEANLDSIELESLDEDI